MDELVGLLEDLAAEDSWHLEHNGAVIVVRAVTKTAHPDADGAVDAALALVDELLRPGYVLVSRADIGAHREALDEAGWRGRVDVCLRPFHDIGPHDVLRLTS